MKFKEKTDHSIDTSGASKTIGGSIDVNQVGKLFSIISSEMYSDPLGSLIRELVSNAKDAHEERGKHTDDPTYAEETPIIVSLTEDSNLDHWLNIKDAGMGMNTDVMTHVYSKWLCSTKDQTDDYIGQWGLGSKSPLAYQNDFIVNTVAEEADGTRKKAMYVVGIGERAPVISEMFKVESDEELGTTIKVKIKSGDLGKCINKCRTQLAYFTGVIYDGDLLKDLNDFQIVESEKFKFRQGVSDNIHISMGPVYYPIDNRLVYDYYHKVVEKNYKDDSKFHSITHYSGIISLFKVPIAVKFNIGELEVTPERENIRYTTDENGVETGFRIMEKMLAAIDELVNLITTKYKKTEDIFEYNHIAYSYNRNHGTVIYPLGENSISFESDGFKKLIGIPIELDKSKYDSNLFRLDFFRNKKLMKLLSIDQFNATSNLSMKRVSQHSITENAVIKVLSNETDYPTFLVNKDYKIPQGKDKAYLWYTKTKGVKSLPLTLIGFQSWATPSNDAELESLLMFVYGESFIIPKGKPYTFGSNEGDATPIDALDKFKKQWKRYLKLVKNTLTKYYDKAPELKPWKEDKEFSDWVTKHSAVTSYNSTAVITDRKEFVIYDARHDKRAAQKQAMTLEDVSDYKHIVAVDRSELDELVMFRWFMYFNIKNQKTKDFFMSNKVLFLATAPTHLKKLQNFKNVFTPLEFMSNNKKLFGKMCAAFKLKERVEKFWPSYEVVELMTFLSADWHELIEDINNNKGSSNYRNAKFVELALKLAEEEGWIDESVFETHEELERIYKSMPLLRFLDIKRGSILTGLSEKGVEKVLMPEFNRGSFRMSFVSSVIRYVLDTGNGKSLREEFKTNPYFNYGISNNFELEPWEKELLKESMEKEKYEFEISSNPKSEDFTLHELGKIRSWNGTEKSNLKIELKPFYSNIL